MNGAGEIIEEHVRYIEPASLRDAVVRGWIRGLMIALLRLRRNTVMGRGDIERGVREGWLVPEEDGWHRFVYEFQRDPRTGRWVKLHASSIRRVRVVKIVNDGEVGSQGEP